MAEDAVLVIDDDPTFREVIGLTLASFGFDALLCGSCCEGLDVLERERSRIRAILVDYWMPGLPPRECGARLRRGAGSIPVILVTAAPDAAARAAELGCTRWLSKPFSPAALQREVASGYRSNQKPSPAWMPK